MIERILIENMNENHFFSSKEIPEVGLPTLLISLSISGCLTLSKYLVQIP